MATQQNQHHLVDPSAMNQTELDQLSKATAEKKQSYEEQERAVYRRIKGKLWL